MTPRPLARIVPITSHPALQPADAVRWSLVRNARERMAAGYYDRDPVRDDIADALIRELQQ